MKDLKEQLNRLRQSPHCENCGAINPKLEKYGDHAQDGYTHCCNAQICKGEEECTFANSEVSTKACCWAVASVCFALKGVDLARQDGMRRFKRDEDEF